MNKNYIYCSNLIKYIDANKELFLNTVAPNPSNLAIFIGQEGPKKIYSIYNVEYEPIKIVNITANVRKDSDCVVLFVEFDETFVRENSDGRALGISISPENSIRLFVYEKGTSYSTGEEVYYVCEYTLDGKHLNYGTTSEYRMSYFAGRIMEVLNEGKK